MGVAGCEMKDLGLASSTVAFPSRRTKQYHSARADDPNKISTAFGAQQTPTVLLALPMGVGTSTFV